MPLPVVIDVPKAEQGSTPTMSSVITTEHVAAIDGLRGAACLAVVFFHCWMHSGNPNVPSMGIWRYLLVPTHVFRYFYGGVDVFFVLSGFCLAYPILSKPDKQLNWKRFFVKRFRRIVPPYWGAVALLATLSLCKTHFHLRPYVTPEFLVWPSLRQLVYTFLLVSFSFNGSFWTLPLEWRWYFILPVLIGIYRKVGINGMFACCGLMSLLSLYILWPSHVERLKFFIGPVFSFLMTFGFGIWAADLYTRRDKSRIEANLIAMAPIGLLISLIGLTVYDAGWELSAVRVLIWAPIAFFFLLCALYVPRFTRFFSLRPLVVVGVFSYSLYLVHEPVIMMGQTLVSNHHWSPLEQFAMEYTGLPIVALTFGYLFFVVAERPFLSANARRTTSRLFASPNPAVGNPRLLLPAAAVPDELNQ